MTITRKLASVGAATALTAAIVATSAGSAHAAGGSECGSGYKFLGSMEVNVPNGIAYVTYNNGWKCLITYTRTPGLTQYIAAGITLTGTPNWNVDVGNYKLFAGPVYLYAPHKCIDWGGWTQGYGYTGFQSRSNEYCE